MSKVSQKYILSDHEDRINPQFKGITQQYSKIKSKRLELDRHKNSLQTNMNYFQRTKDSLDHKLSNKRHQLKWLQSIRERHISDIRYKIQQEQINNKKLQQLRYQSELARKTSKQNINNALTKSKNKKMKTKQEVRKQLDDIKRMKKQRQEQLQVYHTIRSNQLQQQKSQSRNKINKFYRKKNKVLLNSYRDMIRDEEIMSQKSQTQINFIKDKVSSIDDNIKHKKSKLKSIEDEIRKIKLQGYDGKSLFGNSVQLSRITRRSSRPYDILAKESSFITQSLHGETEKY